MTRLVMGGLVLLVFSGCAVNDLEVSMHQHEKIDYVEFPAADMDATKRFFADVFGWAFVEYGPDYMDSAEGGIMTGFYRSELKSVTANGSALVTFFSEHLEGTLAKVEAAGGTIIKPVFSFPGGRRFQFLDPSGNEFAVWSDKDSDGQTIALH